MKTIGEIKEEFSAAREADWNAICQMYETDQFFVTIKRPCFFRKAAASSSWQLPILRLLMLRFVLSFLIYV